MDHPYQGTYEGFREREPYYFRIDGLGVLKDIFYQCENEKLIPIQCQKHANQSSLIPNFLSDQLIF